MIEMEISEDGSRYTVPADQFFFRRSTRKITPVPHCGTPLWSAVNPGKRIDWVKIGEYGWVYRYGAQAHLHRTKTSVFSISSLRSPKIRMHSTRSAERTGGFP